jgi:NAD(P)-dependent dehydrogenase (short-subunit alcohol dehydrogenase family)
MRNLLLAGAAGVGGYWLYQALKPRYDFKNRTALITGGSRGLGLVLARQLAARGARLGLMARDQDELDQAAFELRSHGTRVSVTAGDLKNREDVRRFVGEARAALGPIDVLINDAGIIGVGPLEVMTEEDFELAMRTHFWGALYTTLEVLPEMKTRRQGRIVNITSIGGKVAVPHLLPYCASKFAAVGLSEGLRGELSKYGITVTTVCPGLMRTGSHLNAEFKGRNDEEYAWFALGNAIPGLSMSAERAASKIAASCARGDAELVLTLPAKLAVALEGICPNFVADVMALVNRHILPAPGGVGPGRVKGKASRGLLPAAVTTLSDRAAAENNELRRTPLATESR